MANPRPTVELDHCQGIRQQSQLMNARSLVTITSAPLWPGLHEDYCRIKL